jgi:hypothetical protein
MATHKTDQTLSVADLSTVDLLQQLSDSASLVDVGPGDIRVVEALCGDRRVVIAAFDYARNRGSIGRCEADQLVRAIRYAWPSTPLVFLMNTSGIRVTDSTAGIASLRKVLREAEDARLQGLRMLAMIVKQTFGGASILAALCEQRVVHAGCLYAMSGPRLIEQAAGLSQFDSRNRQVVQNLLGGRARAAVSSDFICVADTPSAYRRALRDWLVRPAPATIGLAKLTAVGAALVSRLNRGIAESVPIRREDAPLDTGASEVLDASLPSGTDLRRAEKVIIASDPASSDIRVLALIAREGCGARDALVLARELLRPLHRGEVHKRCVLIVDSESHAATPIDEQAVLSEVLAYLALVTRWLHNAGQRVDVVVTGLGGGGIQGALGSASSSVAMVSSARLSVLPKKAMQALQKSEDRGSGSIAMAIAVGAVDSQFDRLLYQGQNHVA